MSHFRDLAPLPYFPTRNGSANPFVAVGWLERGEPFTTGPIDRLFFQKLVTLCKDPYEPMQARGWHHSSFRQFPNGIERFEFEGERVEGLYSRNLFVPDRSRIFVAPLAILHYIDHYWYCPPIEFVEAVMKCPPTRSMDFKRLFLESGGRLSLKEE